MDAGKGVMDRGGGAGAGGAGVSSTVAIYHSFKWKAY